MSELISKPDKSTSELDWRKRSLLKLRAKHEAILDAFDFDEFVRLVAAGSTYRELAKAVGTEHSVIGVWIAKQEGDRARALQEARRVSGQACMERALHVLENEGKEYADNENSAGVALARDIARHYEKRGALYDRAQLHDKGELQNQPVQAASMPSFTIKIVSASGNNSNQINEIQGVTIEQDAPMLDADEL